LIDCAPEKLQLAVDSKEDLVQMPVVAEPALSSLQLAAIICAELLTPPPNRFIGYDDAAFRQKILDISEAKAETMVGPDRRVETPGVRRRGVQAVSAGGGTGVITWYPALFSSRTIFAKRFRWLLALTAGPRSDL
jgi:hypothetical protein